jgi:hypothetical protein
VKVLGKAGDKVAEDRFHAFAKMRWPLALKRMGIDYYRFQVGAGTKSSCQITSTFLPTKLVARLLQAILDFFNECRPVVTSLEYGWVYRP